MISVNTEVLAHLNDPGEDWHNQKTKLLQNVHDAVKQVQEHLSTLKDITTPLQIRDSPAQKLCQRLDLIFLHGLKNIAGGYWSFVKEFTDKDSIETILELQHVHSNIGRGRAWLHTALNENLLECYIRSFANNSMLIGRYYTQNAFLADYQKLDMLNMIVTGLEFPVFRLENDLWFLDQTAFPSLSDEATLMRKEISFSSISLTSSILSQQSCASLESTETSHDADSGIETMENSQLNSLDRKLVTHIPKIRVNERVARIMQMNFVANDSEKSDDGMEHFEVTPRLVRRKKKKLAKSRNLSNADETIKPEANFINDTSIFLPLHSEVISNIKLRENGGEKKNAAKRVSFEIDLIANDVNMNFYSNSSSESTSETPMNEEVAFGTVEKSIYDGNCDCEKTKCFRTIYNGLSFDLDQMVTAAQCLEFDATMKEEMSQMKSENPISYCIKVDNNTKLKLILSVFQEDDEQLFKMFHASIGHSADEMILVFPVLTDRRMYLIEHGLSQRHYFVSKVIKYDELDYLLVGVNYQTILFVCKRRRKRYMLSTGDENLSRDIISNLEVAVRRHNRGNNVPSVFTESEMQLIGLKKWIANETKIEQHEVNILHYVFVHWEDPLSHSLLECPAGPSKNGCLMYRFHYQGSSEFLESEATWTPGYFVLRAGVLYQFSIEDGSYKLQMYIRLNSPDFQGCRKISKSDRPHVFELMLDVGRMLHLAGADDYEASQWMQAFLKTISLKISLQTQSLHNIISRVKFKETIGEITEEILHPFKSCCLVLTPDKLFVCQEDLDLFTCTTLGSANLINLTKIQVDAFEHRYCILEFETLEANIFVGDWVLYFNTKYEITKFFKALAKACENLHQTLIEKTQITNKTILENCRDRVMMLQNSWKLGYDMIREPISVIEGYPSPK
uniref:RUN domain-containing protein n=1 Tax=Strigamia maritima TaxID=126957 RepID=T1ITE5_STRMM